MIAALKMGEIGAGLFNPCAILLKLSHCRGKMLGHFGIDLSKASQIRGKGNFQLSVSANDGLLIGNFGCRIGHGDLWIKPRHRIQKQCTISYGTGHWALHPFNYEGRVLSRSACNARAWAQTHDAAIGGWGAQAAAVIGPMAQPNFPCGQRGGRATGRAARIERGIPRVSCLSKDVIEGVTTCAKFGCVGFA